MSSSGPSPLENLQENIGNEDRSPKEAIMGLLMGIGMAIPVFGIGGAILNSSEPVSGFVSGMLWAVILGVLFVGVLMTDLSGNQQQQQQQVGGDSGPTRICPECGWKNPESNNYCNDCGFSFDSGEGDE
jgi:membrane protease subunit (stomatin/prohibitin family)